MYWCQTKFAVFHKNCVWIFALAVIAFQQRSLTCGPFSLIHTDNTIVILDVCLKTCLEKRNPWLQKGNEAKNTDVFSKILLNVGLASGNFCWRGVIFFEKRFKITGKVGNTDMFTDVPVIFCDKGINLGVQIIEQVFKF